MNIDASYYGLYLTGYNIDVDNTNMSTVNLKFTANIGLNPMDRMDNFARDVTLMNTIRNSSDPAVIDMFQKLLTTMALTNGRVMDVEGPRNK